MTRGIHTLADLRDRCHVDADTGCWHWHGCLDERGPRVRFSFEGKSVLCFGRRAAFILSGRNARNKVVHAKKHCPSADCVAPGHATAAPRNEWMATMVRRGVICPTPDGIRKLNALAVKNRKLTDAQAAEIRAAVGVSLSELGRQFGVDHRRIQEIRALRTYKPRTSVAPASVWAWAGGDVGRDAA